MFGRTSSCTIDNLGLIDVNITGNTGVGALIGYDYFSSNVTNCYSTGNVDGVTDEVGGLIGENWAEIDNCYSTANVDGNYNVGGLVGYNNGNVSQSHSTGSVTGSNDVGGLVGDNETNATVSNGYYSTGSVSGDDDIGGLIGENSGPIDNCYSTGNVNGDLDNVGGLIGENSGPIDNCHSTGNVDGDDNVGGLVGYNSSENISQSYSTGSVTGNVDVGGLVGDNASATVSNSYSTGSIIRNSGSSATDFGGFCGELTSSTIEYCYSIGDVIYDGATNPTDKGFVGEEANTENTYTDNFFDSEASNQTSGTGATALITTQMKDYNTFTDVTGTTVGLTTAWDFETNPNDDAANNDYWDIDNTESVNSGYPFLSWQNGTDTSLPVELASFTGENAKGSMQLTWVTESEIRNQGFILERQNAQNKSWQEIASFKTDAALRGQGSTSKRSVYNFTDHAVKAGLEYSYRLSNVSFEGKVKIHDDMVLQVKATPTIPSVFRVQTPYPNPFNPTTTIAYSLPAEAPVRIVVYNLTGQLVSVVFHQTQPAGNHQMSLSLPDYASGAYFLRISTPEHQQTRKLLLMK